MPSTDRGPDVESLHFADVSPQVTYANTTRKIIVKAGDQQRAERWAVHARQPLQFEREVLETEVDLKRGGILLE